ncbi:MAG TPA: DUF6010 family protein [Acidobacteriota bacterium]|nr:DUF6010 family protein [Acidobacteriota bacterium]
MLVRAIVVGVISGALTALLAWSPWIPDHVAFHTVALAIIGAIYLGFAFSDGRISIMILEISVGTVFVVLALLGMWVAPMFIAVGLVLHGVWDLMHRPGGVSTKLPSWYPPFCAAYDFVFAGIFFYLARDIAIHAH